MELTFDVYTYSYVINAYAKAGKVDEVKKVLLEMSKKGYPPNVDAYNMVIRGLCRAGHVDEAVEIKRLMIEHGLVPDKLYLFNSCQWLLYGKEIGRCKIGTVGNV